MPDSAAPPSRRALGAAWEAIALATLRRHGLRELARNVNYRFGELDLVMRDGDTVAFVEVRYRSPGRFGDGALSVDRHKQRRIARAAAAWLVANPRLARAPCRFDVVSLAGTAECPEVEWIRNAFTLDDV